MSRVDELIAELCPDGVEFFEVAQIFEIRNGYTPSKSQSSYWANGTIPWFRMEDIRENGRILAASLQNVHESAVKGKGVFPANSILVATSATIGEHALVTVPHLSNQRFTSLSLNNSFNSKLDIYFVNYYCFVLDEWCRSNTSTSSFASVDMSGFRKFKFPVPPLEVQREIVRILDAMTSLQAELQAELAARRSQYELYRNSILGFKSDEVSYMALSEISMSIERVKWNSVKGKSFRYIDLSSVDRVTCEIGETAEITATNAPNRAQQIVRKGDVIFATTRPAQMRWTVIPEEFDGEIASSGYCVIRPDNSIALTSFVAHLLGTDSFKTYVEQNQIPGNYPSIPDSSVRNYKIPIPQMEIQVEVTRILDTMASLLAEIRAESLARQTQYEYYRDKLLTFKELAA